MSSDWMWSGPPSDPVDDEIDEAIASDAAARSRARDRVHDARIAINAAELEVAAMANGSPTTTGTPAPLTQPRIDEHEGDQLQSDDAAPHTRPPPRTAHTRPPRTHAAQGQVTEKLDVEMPLRIEDVRPPSRTSSLNEDTSNDGMSDATTPSPSSSRDESSDDGGSGHGDGGSFSEQDGGDDEGPAREEDRGIGVICHQTSVKYKGAQHLVVWNGEEYFYVSYNKDSPRYRPLAQVRFVVTNEYKHLHSLPDSPIRVGCDAWPLTESWLAQQRTSGNYSHQAELDRRLLLEGRLEWYDADKGKGRIQLQGHKLWNDQERGVFFFNSILQTAVPRQSLRKGTPVRLSTFVKDTGPKAAEMYAEVDHIVVDTSGIEAKHRHSMHPDTLNSLCVSLGMGGTLPPPEGHRLQRAIIKLGGHTADVNVDKALNPLGALRVPNIAELQVQVDLKKQDWLRRIITHQATTDIAAYNAAIGNKDHPEKPTLRSRDSAARHALSNDYDKDIIIVPQDFQTVNPKKWDFIIADYLESASTPTRIFFVVDLEPHANPATAHLTAPVTMRAYARTRRFLSGYHASTDFMPFGAEDVTGMLRHNMGSTASRVLILEFSSTTENDCNSPLTTPSKLFSATPHAEDDGVSEPGLLFDNRCTILTHYSDAALVNDPGLANFLPHSKITLPNRTEHAHAVIHQTAQAADHFTASLVGIISDTPSIPINFMPARLHYDERPSTSCTIHLNQMTLQDGFTFLRESIGEAYLYPIGHNIIHLIPVLSNNWTQDSLLQRVQELDNLAFRKLGSHPFKGVMLSNTYHPLYHEPLGAGHMQAPRDTARTPKDASDGYGYLTGLIPGIQLDVLRRALSHFAGTPPEAPPRSTWIQTTTDKAYLLRFAQPHARAAELAAPLAPGPLSQQGIQIELVDPPTDFQTLFDPFESPSASAPAVAAPSTTCGSANQQGLKPFTSASGSRYTALLPGRNPAQAVALARAAPDSQQSATTPKTSPAGTTESQATKTQWSDANGAKAKRKQRKRTRITRQEGKGKPTPSNSAPNTPASPHRDQDQPTSDSDSDLGSHSDSPTPDCRPRLLSSSSSSSAEPMTNSDSDHGSDSSSCSEETEATREAALRKHCEKHHPEEIKRKEADHKGTPTARGRGGRGRARGGRGNASASRPTTLLGHRRQRHPKGQ